jgi:hypothetical protein
MGEPQKFEAYEEKNIASRMRRCVHFNGIMGLGLGAKRDEDRTCDAGVLYREVKEPKPTGGFRIPCFSDEGHVAGCAKAQFPTRVEAEADWLESKAHVKDYFAAIERGECPIHKRPVTLRHVGHCVYGDCGCRLYQGKLPKAKAAVVG